MCQELDLEIDPKIIPSIAYGFAGGIGNSGSVCGAVSGAIMALSYKLGKGEGMEDVMRNLGVMQQYRRRFEEKHGTISCRELTGTDLSTPEGVAAFMQSDVPQKVCFPVVGSAYELVLEILNKQS